MGTANKNLNEPLNGSAGWDVPLNSNATILDLALGGSQVMNLTGNVTSPIVLAGTYLGSFPANAASYLPQQIYITGTIGINTVVQVPAGVGGIWTITNATTGNFTASFSVVGSAGAVSLPAGATTLVQSDGTNPTAIGLSPNAVFRAGDLVQSANASARTGWLLCYGQAVSRTTYAALFAAIGTSYGSGDGSTTFNIPDCRGRAWVGVDNMGGTPANRMPGWAAGTAGGEYTHTLVTGEMPVHAHTASDSGHSHADAGHSHTVGAVSTSAGGGASTGTGFATQTLTTSVGYANIQTGHASISVTNTGGGGAHNNVQPSITGYVFIYTGL